MKYALAIATALSIATAFAPAYAAEGNEFIGTEVCTPTYVQEGAFKVVTNGCSPIKPGGNVGLKQVRECFATVALCEQAATAARAALYPYSWGGCPFICAQ